MHSERPTDGMTCGKCSVPRNCGASSLAAKRPPETSRVGARPGSLWSTSLWLGSQKTGSGPPVGEGSEGRDREGRGRRHHLRCGRRRDGGHRRGRGGCAGQRVRSAGAAAAPAAPSAAPAAAAAGRSYGGWARRSGGVPYGRRVPEPGLAHLCPVQVTPTAGPPRRRPFPLRRVLDPTGGSESAPLASACPAEVSAASLSGRRW